MERAVAFVGVAGHCLDELIVDSTSSSALSRRGMCRPFPLFSCFKKRYNFLYENELPAEKEELKKMMKTSNDPEVIGEMKNRLAWIDKQLKSASAKRSDRDILSEHKKKEREAAKQGKQPYYLKKSDIRKQKLIEKYKDLKASGKLESFIEKRRRKNASKDHKYVPYRRSNNEQ